LNQQFAIKLAQTGKMMTTVLLLALYAGVVNIATFLCYWIDKEQAQVGGWRVAENTLLLLGLIGGTIGGLLAQRIFRHKKRKASFQGAFWFIATLQVAAAVFFAMLLID
jgi:uncharacterized membrane protein YsdA (DUF1294 family)